VTAGVPAPQRIGEFGTNGGLILDNTMSGVTGVDRDLAAMAAGGLGLVRASPLWEITEPQAPVGGQHRYRWQTDDFLAAKLAAHGFKWIALLGYSPGWASDTPNQLHGAPRTAADFAAYAGAVAHRYHGPIVAYEIWNEENSTTFWRPRPDPARYAALYLAARSAIHREDPGVPVLVGGLADAYGAAFLSQLLSRPEIRADMVDGVAIHPYGRDPAAVLARVAAYRTLMRQSGAADVPLYVTEYGWSTQPAGSPTWAPERERVQWIGQVARALLHSDCDVRLVTFYAWKTAERKPNLADDWYGVAHPGVPLGPLIKSMAGIVQELRRPAPSVPLCPA
jgi:hypothetical protein